MVYFDIFYWGKDLKSEILSFGKLEGIFRFRSVERALDILRYFSYILFLSFLDIFRYFWRVGVEREMKKVES